MVFWQGINSGSGWVTENNKWMADQSWEIGGPHGCAEHMADKRGRFNHVRLIENTAARVVVHWRYASIDVGYVFGRTGVWADEYYTIYPDGVGVRCVEGIDGGWHDTQFLSATGNDLPGQHGPYGPDRGQHERPERGSDVAAAQPCSRQPDRGCLHQADQLQVQVEGLRHLSGGGARSANGASEEQSKHTPDPFAGPWNHWPVGLNPSDGRYAVSTDRVTHAALGGADRTGSTILYGFTDQPAASLVPLAKSWHHPPAIANTAGCESKGYDPSQRAYVLAATGRAISFTLQGSTETPVLNPCFEIKRWDSGIAARVAIDGKLLQPGRTSRQGIIRDTNAKPTLVIWLELESVSTIRVTVSGD